MNTNMKHDTRPTTDRIHADLVATRAARAARVLDHLDTAACARVYIDAYAAALLEG